jgi:hypothetical protein
MATAPIAANERSGAWLKIEENLGFARENRIKPGTWPAESPKPGLCNNPAADARSDS